MYEQATFWNENVMKCIKVGFPTLKEREGVNVCESESERIKNKTQSNKDFGRVGKWGLILVSLVTHSTQHITHLHSLLSTTLRLPTITSFILLSRISNTTTSTHYHYIYIYNINIHT